jgi:hypothetical protein
MRPTGGPRARLRRSAALKQVRGVYESLLDGLQNSIRTHRSVPSHTDADPLVGGDRRVGRSSLGLWPRVRCRRRTQCLGRSTLQASCESRRSNSRRDSTLNPVPRAFSPSCERCGSGWPHLPASTERRVHVEAAFEQLASALGDRYRLERELGRGGMATVLQRRPRPITAVLRTYQRPASRGPGGADISLTPEFLFLERGTPTGIFQRHKLAPS